MCICIYVWVCVTRVCSAYVCHYAQEVEVGEGGGGQKKVLVMMVIPRAVYFILLFSGEA